MLSQAAWSTMVSDESLSVTAEPHSIRTYFISTKYFLKNESEKQLVYEYYVTVLRAVRAYGCCEHFARRTLFLLRSITGTGAGTIILLKTNRKMREHSIIVMKLAHCALC
jgi:hypothetical protein